MTAARRDARRHAAEVECLDQLAHAVDRLQLGVEGGDDLLARTSVELLGQLRPEVPFDLG